MSHRRSSRSNTIDCYRRHLVARAEDPAIRVRLQAALALGDRCREEPAALDALGKIAVRDADDPWMRLAILSGLAESSLSFIPLCDRIPSATGRAQLLSQAAAIVGVRRRVPELSSLLGLIASRRGYGQAEPSDPGRSIDALTTLAGLGRGLERSGPPLHALIAAPSPELKSELERLATLWPCAHVLAVSNQPVAERLVALDVLSRGRPDLAEAIVPRPAGGHPTGRDSGRRRSGGRACRSAIAGREGPRPLERLGTGHAPRAAVSPGRFAACSRNAVIQALERQTIAPGELDAATREALNAPVEPAA